MEEITQVIEIEKDVIVTLSKQSYSVFKITLPRIELVRKVDLKVDCICASHTSDFYLAQGNKLVKTGCQII